MEKSMAQLEGNSFGVKAKCLTIYKKTHMVDLHQSHFEMQ